MLTVREKVCIPPSKATTDKVGRPVAKAKLSEAKGLVAAVKSTLKFSSTAIEAKGTATAPELPVQAEAEVPGLAEEAES